MKWTAETSNGSEFGIKHWINSEVAVDLRNQQAAFCLLTLFVLALLLVLHTLFVSILGEPSNWLILLLAVGFSVKMAELIWVQFLSPEITERAARIETAVSVVGTFVLTALLAYLTNRDDSPYFVLLAIPILQCAHRCGPVATAITIFAADGMIIFWLWHFFHLHPPARPTEYLEAGMISIIYALMGSLVWFLVKQLHLKQVRLSASLVDLEATRERLVREEKLAAVGRLASGIAHEIRNPVSMISSALATAASPSIPQEERREMFAVAARESARLEHLTADFLTYARPTPLRCAETNVRDLVTYIGDVARMHASSRAIEINTQANEGLIAILDRSLMEGALLNLMLNAIDATPDSGTIQLRAVEEGQMLHLEVQDSGPAIAAQHLERIFEPFFTTKPAGTGLGLAIARGIARAHGGDLWVKTNTSKGVTFTLAVQKDYSEHIRKEMGHG